MPAFAPELLAACASEREVTLTTYGRVTGRPTHVIIWITCDGEHVYIRSGQGLATRDWPRNLLARGEGILQIDGHDVPVRAQLLDPLAARRVSELVTAKYGIARPITDGDTPTPGETATFELMPA
jgi:hypothetical protein